MLYDHATLEAKWRRRWEASGVFEIDVRAAKHPFYNLMMFPYPSAEGLHIGNVFAFTGADIHGRFMAMQGKDVLEPFGYDAFGIHSENFALKQNIHPTKLVPGSIARFREQMKRLGTRISWRHELTTTDPRYYRWTQWLFVQLFKRGLAERRAAPVNWCPSCKTVLADEQVIAGRCERCSSEITHRDLEQWFFKITAYAERLLKNLDWIDWSPVVKTAQRNWIGRSEGLETSFPIEGKPESLGFFTTRPDTIFGVTFMALAPEHPLVKRIAAAQQRDAVEAYVRQSSRKTALDRQASGRTGVFTGNYCINPLNGERVPIFVADYVLMTYGTGAIMAVPGHDERDHEFAKRYGLPVKIVTTDAAAAEAIIARLERAGTGRRRVTYRLRDWLVSRQRYWGTPIPIVHCDKCGPVAVSESELPVELPYVEEFRPTGTERSPLALVESFLRTTCVQCGGEARRETDVLDTFVDSSWYYLRYPSTQFDDRPFDAELTRRWLPVHMYIGGKEHSVLHLLYARFIAMALHDMGYLTFEEPFQRFRGHGLLILRGAKISKSRGNIVNPDDYYASHGADTLRTYLMFSGRFEEGGEFSDDGIEGAARFIQRVWDLVQRYRSSDGEPHFPTEARQAMHRAIQLVTRDVAGLQYNTAIAFLMEYVNSLQHRAALHRDEIRTLLLLLAPFAPHVTEELWEQTGGGFSIHQQAWPEADAALTRRREVSLVVQVNGKTRDVVELPTGAAEAAAVERARASDKVQRHLDGKTVVRTIYVPDRLINFVVRDEL